MRRKHRRLLMLVILVFATMFLASSVRDEEQMEVLAVNAAVTPEPSRMYELAIREVDTVGKMVENDDMGGVDILYRQNGEEQVLNLADVKANAWYSNAITFAIANGLMSGIKAEEGSGENMRTYYIFRPDYGVTREQFAVLVYNLFDADKVDSVCHFTDVEEDAWYFEAVNWIVESGYLGGVDEERFGVGEYIACEQAVLIIHRIFGSPKPNTTLADYPYAARVSDYAKNAIAWAWSEGLIAEDECVWYPTQAISRAQLSLLIMRCVSIVNR